MHACILIHLALFCDKFYNMILNVSLIFLYLIFLITIPFCHCAAAVPNITVNRLNALSFQLEVILVLRVRINELSAK